MNNDFQQETVVRSGDALLRDIAFDIEYSVKRKKLPENTHIEEQEVFIDPASLFLIARIIMDIVSVLKSCRHNKVQNVAYHPITPFQHRILNRIIRRRLGWIKYFRSGKEYKRAILERATRLSEKECEELNKLTPEEINI